MRKEADSIPSFCMSRRIAFALLLRRGGVRRGFANGSFSRGEGS
jgi:hypothetical protein